MHIKDSARLSYHYITEQDADFLWELDQDELVMKYINGGKKSSKEDIREIFVPRFQAYSNPALGWGLWRVETLVEKESIGWILVRPFGFFTQHPESDNMELGWRFKHHTWGKGYATEAAKSEIFEGTLPARAIDMACPITLFAVGAGGADGSMAVA